MFAAAAVLAGEPALAVAQALEPVIVNPPCAAGVAGRHAGHLACTNQLLEAAARQAQAQAGLSIPVVGAGSSDVRTGVANQTATRQRMGDALGVSVHPQRPDRPPPAPRP